jgi:uncharacterized membrane protein
VPDASTIGGVASNPRMWRQLTLWLHIVTSVGWMTLALVLVALLYLATAATDPDTVAPAITMAHYLDRVLLAPLGNASAATGIMLGLGTAWGLAHHRWVLAKFAITFVQFYAGIFLLSGALAELADAPRTPSPLLVAGTAAMAGAIAFQAWLSVAKPGGRTRWSRDRAGQPIRLPTAAPWVFAIAVLTPLTDIAIGTVVGFPTPFLSAVALVVAVVVRRRTLRAMAGSPVRTHAARAS